MQQRDAWVEVASLVNQVLLQLEQTLIDVFEVVDACEVSSSSREVSLLKNSLGQVCSRGVGIAFAYHHEHLEDCAFARLRLDNDVTLHALDDPFTDIQSKTGAIFIQFLVILQFSKEFEKFIEVFSLHSDSAVLHLDVELPVQDFLMLLVEVRLHGLSERADERQTVLYGFCVLKHLQIYSNFPLLCEL